MRGNLTTHCLIFYGYDTHFYSEALNGLFLVRTFRSFLFLALVLVGYNLDRFFLR